MTKRGREGKSDIVTKREGGRERERVTERKRKYAG